MIRPPLVFPGQTDGVRDRQDKTLAKFSTLELAECKHYIYFVMEQKQLTQGSFTLCKNCSKLVGFNEQKNIFCI